MPREVVIAGPFLDALRRSAVAHYRDAFPCAGKLTDAQVSECNARLAFTVRLDSGEFGVELLHDLDEDDTVKLTSTEGTYPDLDAAVAAFLEAITGATQSRQKTKKGKR